MQGRASPETLQTAMALHRAGRLDEAEAAYTRLLAADPLDADALHLLGVIADARGDHASGAQLIEQALAIRDSPRFHANHGMVLGHLDRHEDALAAYAAALAQRPDYPEALNNRGASLQALDRLEEAEASFRAAIVARNDFADAWTNLGHVLRAQRRLEDATAAYGRAIELNPAMAALQGALGTVLWDRGRPVEAEAAFRHQMELAPGDPMALTNLAAALGEQDRAAEAAHLLPAALALDRARPETYCNLGAALQSLGRLEEAEAACRRALALRPGYGDAMANLGAVLREAGRLEEAEAMQRRVVAQRPGAAPSYGNLAVTLIDQGRRLEALAVLDLALGLAPHNADARHHRALVLLLEGRLDEGWPAYEVRFDTKQGRPDRRHFTAPQWTGEPLEGRTILLHAEQGFGDTIQFARYAPLVTARGGRVVLEVQAPLHCLLGRLPAVAAVLRRGEALPDFAWHCPLLSLPGVFRTTLANVPAPLAVPPAAPETLERWRRRLPPGPAVRVGLVWAGNPNHINDRRRSVPFADLSPLWPVPGIAWVSLQAGPRAADLAALGDGFMAVHDLADFAETAAAIRQLDLVIAADTAVAHLAASLGISVWLMLPFAPDWRWGVSGPITPWYPAMRLFRQGPERTWGPVLRSIADALTGHDGRQ